MTGSGNEAQVRLVAEQVVDAALVKVHGNLNPPEARIPTPLRWAAGIVAGLFTAGSAAMALWLVTSVSNMQVTLARMDERLANQNDAQLKAIEQLDGRVTDLEAYHRRTPE